MSSKGNAKTSRRAILAGQLITTGRLADGRRPITWSHSSMAFSSGSRWFIVKGSTAVVTSTSGK
jgi:hypothetical protein